MLLHGQVWSVSVNNASSAFKFQPPVSFGSKARSQLSCSGLCVPGGRSGACLPAYAGVDSQDVASGCSSSCIDVKPQRACDAAPILGVHVTRQCAHQAVQMVVGRPPEWQMNHACMEVSLQGCIRRWSQGGASGCHALTQRWRWQLARLQGGECQLHALAQHARMRQSPAHRL